MALQEMSKDGIGGREDDSGELRTGQRAGTEEERKERWTNGESKLTTSTSPESSALFKPKGNGTIRVSQLAFSLPRSPSLSPSLFHNSGENTKRQRVELTSRSPKPPPPPNQQRSHQTRSHSSQRVDVGLRFRFRRRMVDGVQNSFHEEGGGVGEEDG